MVRDRAGNSLKTANNFGSLGFTSQTRREVVGVSDLNDLYRFQLLQNSRVEIELSGLKRNTNADIELLSLKTSKQKTFKEIGATNFQQLTRRQLNQFLNRLGRSHQVGNQNDVISTTLAPGEYYLRVTRQQGEAQYTL